MEQKLEKREKYVSTLLKYEKFLSKSQVQVLKLYFYEDLSLQEIANELAITRSAVFDALKKGKAKLDQFIDL